MKTIGLVSSLLLAASLISSSVLAQDNASAPASAAPEAPVTLNGVVAVEKLPTPTSLLKDAEAEGLTILRMEQTPDRMIVVYQYPDGSTRAFAYTTTVELAAASPVRAATLSKATYTVVAEPAPAPAVVYAQPETIYYTQREPLYYSPRYIRAYDPAWDFWTPLAVGVGLGWGFGGHHSHGGSYGHARGHR
ncbi:MAG: hypothetical protein EBT98_04965 [Opitutaceae bacterium]|jgi:hypothetical protein|nr:hypothetical protein [Opitutaceae bacterium]NBR59347.1 hypothetical protein [Opitutaceae bacterium]